ncbi:Hypothetical protein VV2_1692 [Vibrio vulnificus CMCP6]|uniref:Uncharacterized protein n=1 Tax=Vibrio vulnificus (strain CMCP6) TaxID=216895 RepID=A0A3Q0MFC6_VIBVU|nr:Hypothetical protein VV2_1692 [Vibrio vulnificus CMCP6]
MKINPPWGVVPTQRPYDANNDHSSVNHLERRGCSQCEAKSRSVAIESERTSNMCQAWKGDQEDVNCTTMVQGVLFEVWRKINGLNFLDVYSSGALGAFRKSCIIRTDTVPVITMTSKVRR